MTVRAVLMLGVFLLTACVGSSPSRRGTEDVPVLRLARADGLEDEVWPRVIERGEWIVAFFGATNAEDPRLHDLVTAFEGVSGRRLLLIVQSDVHVASSESAVVVHDERGDLARQLGVDSVPRYILFRNGKREKSWAQWDASRRAVEAPASSTPFAVHDEGEELATRYAVTVWVDRADQVADARRALARAREWCQNVARNTWSEWRLDSEISKINARAGRAVVPVSPEMRRMLAGALHIAEATEGAFDITFRPWAEMWARAENAGRGPTDTERQQARARVGYRHVTLSEEGVRFERDGIKLGIAGLAKGHIIDGIHAMLAAAGYPRALVNIGGDIKTSGEAPAGGAHSIAITDPFGREANRGLLAVRDRALATSGNYVRYRDVAGRRIGHILDPRTGEPPAFLGSVTVITKDATMADALATALFVMGPEKGLAFVRRTDGVEAVFVTRASVACSWEAAPRLASK